MISILIGSGFEESEAIVVFDLLTRAGLDVSMVSVTGSLEVSSARKIILRCDLLIDEVLDKTHQLLVIPGGIGGVRRILASQSAKKLIQAQDKTGAYLASICAGALVLDKFQVLEGYQYTCYPGIEEEIETGNYLGGDVVVDRKRVTATCPGTAALFGLQLIELLAGPKVRERVEKDWNGQS